MLNRVISSRSSLVAARSALVIAKHNTSARFPLQTMLLLSASRNYQMGPFVNVTRRPQLTDEQRAKVVIDQSTWPAEFKDYDPEDPFKNTPDYIEGMNTFDLWLLGVEMAFIITFFELVFPRYFGF